jgi:PKD repeat protein
MRVSADGSASSDDHGITRYYFVCGNGQRFDAGARVVCTYTRAGSYTVTLEVTDSAGATRRISTTLSVSPQRLTPSLTARTRIAQARSALYRIGVHPGNNTVPAGYSLGSPPRGVRFVISHYAVQTIGIVNGHSQYVYEPLRAGQPIPNAAIVAIVLRPVRT